MFRDKPWMWVVLLMAFLLAMSIGFLVIALNNPPAPYEHVRTMSPDHDFTEA